MKKIRTDKIQNAVKRLCIESNIYLRKDILTALNKALYKEKNSRAKNIIKVIIDNARIARKKKMPICQDTGMVEVFCGIGRDLYIDGDIDKAINNGIRLGYKQGFLRKSVVSDPINRKNTGTNTPAVIHYNFIKGEHIKITVVPKGFGSENASSLVMLKPTDSEEEIINFIVDAIKESGADACPPLILGVGIGGTLDKAATLATEAILRPIDKTNPKRYLTLLENKIIKRVNKTNIGPGGLGGDTTCIGVSVLDFPTHIAGMPVCVKISCHATRNASAIIN